MNRSLGSSERALHPPWSPGDRAKIAGRSCHKNDASHRKHPIESINGDKGVAMVFNYFMQIRRKLFMTDMKSVLTVLLSGLLRAVMNIAKYYMSNGPPQVPLLKGSKTLSSFIVCAERKQNDWSFQQSNFSKNSNQVWLRPCSH